MDGVKGGCCTRGARRLMTIIIIKKADDRGLPKGTWNVLDRVRALYEVDGYE